MKKIALALAALLISYRVSNIKVVTAVFCFALMAPLGALLGSQMQEQTEYLTMMIALSVGIILHLSTTILVESNEEHQVSWKKVLPMLLGASFSLLSTLFH